jgi:hypothetical protein
MPRSERCRSRGNCLHGIALLALAQAPVAGGAVPASGEVLALGERPGVGRLIGRSGRRTGLSPAGDRPLGLGLGELKAEREDDRGRAGNALAARRNFNGSWRLLP